MLRAPLRVWLARAAKVLGALAAVYLLASAGLYLVMRQRPMVAGKGLSYVPGPAFAVLPMEWMWVRARAGRLQVGDPAPDFDLPTLDRKQSVRLSSLRGSRPVVLVFGSYT
jgi:hypothetical protein